MSGPSPWKTKTKKTSTDDFSNIQKTSRRSPVRTEKDRGAEFHTSFFQNFLEFQNKHHYSKFTDRGTI